MAMAERSATTGWDGDLAHGAGTAQRGQRRAQRPVGHLGVADRALRRQDEPGGADRSGALVVLLDGAVRTA